MSDDIPAFSDWWDSAFLPLQDDMANVDPEIFKKFVNSFPQTESFKEPLLSKQRDEKEVDK